MARRWLISLLILTAAMAARASTDARLIEPAAHAEVVAGETLFLTWDAANVPPEVEEWEAFLSVDGGRTYPIRITPHLNAGIRRFAWTVPLLPGADVSILLRLGDERAEHEIAFLNRLHIRRTIPPEMLFRENVVRKTATLDDHGQTLTEWIDGPRDGSVLQRVVVSATALGAAHHLTQREPHALALVRSNCGRIEPAANVSRLIETSRTAPRPPSQSRNVDLLTLARRLNI